CNEIERYAFSLCNECNEKRAFRKRHSRIIEAYESLDVSPTFAIGDATVKVTLPVSGAVSLSQDKRVVLVAIPKGASHTRHKVETAASISKEKAVRLLNSLMEKGLVSRLGSGRSTRYARK
ncbi:MAG: hypothetical protein ACI364_03225, partial [Coriobacteriales bacterium]